MSKNVDICLLTISTVKMRFGVWVLLLYNFLSATYHIIESLYEDKVDGKISEERYLKMSDTYKSEQRLLKERVKTLKSEIRKAKEQDDRILDFMMLIHKYSSFEELTPEFCVRLSTR